MFRLEKSIRRAQERVGRSPSRRWRSDRGAFRFEPVAQRILDELIGGQERPRTRALLSELAARCKLAGVSGPSRATVYKYLERARVHRYELARLPEPVRATLYNLAGDAPVPGHQVAFRAINEGGLAAVSFAAGMPWLDLYQARRLRGWRPRSCGLIEAICRARRI